MGITASIKTSSVSVSEANSDELQLAPLFFERIFQLVLNLLRKIAKPVQVGNGFAVDMSQIILLILFLIILKFLL
ncbi:hypothetical protein FACS1894201_08230 [Bacteroidia bacterium]|nr:hypothetical protein FACS1894201_08230 [Bacteroidia bacterium]